MFERKVSIAGVRGGQQRHLKNPEQGNKIVDCTWLADGTRSRKGEQGGNKDEREQKEHMAKMAGLYRNKSPMNWKV